MEIVKGLLLLFVISVEGFGLLKYQICNGIETTAPEYQRYIAKLIWIVYYVYFCEEMKKNCFFVQV
jgi:hypothetical protein